jgi:hypothetical protein
MTDFDTVLERLVSDPSFAAALAADPAGTLAGYRLSADERDLLHSQVSGDAGGQSTVETRTNQSSVFGMLSPLAGLGGIVDSAGLGQPEGAGFSQASGPPEGFGPRSIAAAGSGPAGAGLGASAGFGEAGQQGFGAAPGAGTSGFGLAARSGGLAGLGDEIGQHLGQAGQEPSGAAPADLPPPEGYHTRVDVDGDGHWDRHSLHGRAGGGVDIHVDLNRDGRVDFVGHDVDADGLVDSADYDKDRDGFFETHTYDDNRDGWIDRSRTERPPS